MTDFIFDQIIPPDQIIPLERICYDPMARGTLCRNPYPNHPRGCPNFPKCIQERPDFKDIAHLYRWFAVIEVFDLKSHVEKMSKKYPHWTERQCRNPLYWQGSVRKKLRERAEKFGGDIILDIPEACGIEVFETMRSANVVLEQRPQIVRKVMIVGRKI